MNSETRKKHHKIDTVEGQRTIFTDIQKKPKPPAHCNLFKGAEPFFDDVIDCRPVSTWNGQDLSLAVELANDMLMLANLKKDLHENGYLTARGRTRPESRVMAQTITRINAMTKLLKVNTSAVHGRDPGTNRRLRKAEERAAAKVNEMKDHGGLIPTQNH